MARRTQRSIAERLPSGSPTRPTPPFAKAAQRQTAFWKTIVDDSNEVMGTIVGRSDGGKPLKDGSSLEVVSCSR
jgi:hypothetical protein